MNSNIKYFYNIDLLRGIAAISVLFWHYQHFFIYQNLDSYKDILPNRHLLFLFYNHGESAVQLFWVISGFVFTYSYIGKLDINAKDFTLSRFARLYPLHLVTLCVVALLQYISNSYVLNKSLIYTNNDYYHFVLNLLFIPSWGFEKGSSFNAPIWSVSIEILIYIIFYLSLKLIRKYKIWYCIFIIGLFYIFRKIQTPLLPFMDCGIYFFSGVAIYFITVQEKLNSKIVFLIATCIILAILCIFYYIFPDYIGKIYQYILLFPSLVLLFSMLDHNKMCYNSAKNINILGEMTYSIYLWHIPIQFLFILVIEYHGINRDVYKSSYFLLLYLIVVLVISYFSYKGIEIRSRNLIKNIFK